MDTIAPIHKASKGTYPLGLVCAPGQGNFFALDHIFPDFYIAAKILKRPPRNIYFADYNHWGFYRQWYGQLSLSAATKQWEKYYVNDSQHHWDQLGVPPSPTLFGIYIDEISTFID